MKIKEYNRNKAIEYATKWAYKRNPRYYNFDGLGGGIARPLYLNVYMLVQA